MSGMLAKDPADRMEWKEIFAHPKIRPKKKKIVSERGESEGVALLRKSMV